MNKLSKKILGLSVFTYAAMRESSVFATSTSGAKSGITAGLTEAKSIYNDNVKPFLNLILLIVFIGSLVMGVVKLNSQQGNGKGFFISALVAIVVMAIVNAISV